MHFRHEAHRLAIVINRLAMVPFNRISASAGIERFGKIWLEADGSRIPGERRVGISLVVNRLSLLKARLRRERVRGDGGLHPGIQRDLRRDRRVFCGYSFHAEGQWRQELAAKTTGPRTRQLVRDGYRIESPQ